MLTFKKLWENARTSSEVADALRTFEGTGELPGPEFLPPPEQGVRSVHPSPLLFAATDIGLGVKWGIRDFDAIANREEGRRLTRKLARAIREGAPAPGAESRTYRGHRGLRGVPPVTSKQTSVARNEHIPPPPETEPAVNSGARLEDASEDETTLAVSALLEDNSTPEGEAEQTDSSVEDGSPPKDVWEIACSGPSRELWVLSIVSALPRFFPSWFDLCEAADQLGPLPDDWQLSPAGTPVLPEFEGTCSSFLADFWEEVDSSDEECDFRTAIEASVQTALFEQACCNGDESDSLAAMAVIVEVVSEDEQKPEIPAGSNGRYSKAQKGKSVPRTSEQHEFLKEFVTGRSSDRKPSVPPADRHQGKSKTSRKSGPDKFKCESSQVPEGGWFRTSGGGGGRIPPSSPSSPSSSSSDSSSSNGSSFSDNDNYSSSESDRPKRGGKNPSQKRHRKNQKDTKHLWKALAGVKIKHLFTWNGTADLDLFNQWTYEVDTYCELHGLDDDLALKIIVQFLSGEPSKFFMKHVAMCRHEWTLKTLYEALFDYCFPSDFKARLRYRLERTIQGKSKVRDFVHEIQHLAVRFPDITDFQLVQIFWRGIHSYSRVYLIEKGLNPEWNTLEKLVKYAVQREEAYAEARHEERAFEGQVPGRDWGRFANRTSGPEPHQSRREGRDGHRNNRHEPPPTFQGPLS